MFLFPLPLQFPVEVLHDEVCLRVVLNLVVGDVILTPFSMILYLR